ncbi:signal peptidase I [Candidatus Woesearchaeota archaeon]|jgi:signal peptidase I|nr:signal peptidase I [Candidatus Woesearchaeota archaeon]MBT3304760.1 signal peptidase I [Candidatus Woesearchaeota archaeon]MBT4367904.1 signal peptidase I [Candidatus Woesearchaeota archaeon]MBT4712392.1 signal peptidase I [Candidatus Woesearchaeota archaeon]MBT6639304.1 signal peptidase I [Candidatus Woesearchaeota archaeon]
MTLKKIWKFIWHDDSITSWIVNIILAFVIIKFLFYPALGLVLGTTHPIVAVVSSSMEHDLIYDQLTEDYIICGKHFDIDKHINFNSYWEICGDLYEDRNIDQAKFSKFKMKNGFNMGDIIFLSSKKTINQGDIPVYWSGRVYPIIHRVVAVNETHIVTKGDHNSGVDAPVQKDKIIGKALFKIPYLGWIKIWAVNVWSLII